jgi:hypothetical protein
MSDADIERCVRDRAERDAGDSEKYAGRSKLGFVCGDWAKDVLDGCCLEGSEVSVWTRTGWLLDFMGWMIRHAPPIIA